MGKFIENITTSANCLSATTDSYTPHYHAENFKPLDGFVRTNRGQLEYYDSNQDVWYPLPGSSVKIEMHSIHQTVLDWAMEKMFKEQEELKLAEKYPAFKAAKQNYEIVKAMVENE